jgi:hypothetical protein
LRSSRLILSFWIALSILAGIAVFLRLNDTFKDFSLEFPGGLKVHI